jgi:hypothetical protein
VKIRVENGGLHPGLPEKLFEGDYQWAEPVRSYDVGPDARFLLRKFDAGNRSRIREAMAPTRIEVVQNWFEELRDKVPVDSSDD